METTLPETERSNWKLAMTGLDVARFEARKRSPGGALGREDLHQEALLGLLDAAQRFDEDRDVSFSTYARWWVRARLTKALEHGQGPVRVPDSVTRSLRRLRRAERELASHGEPGGRRAAELADVEPRRAERLMELTRSTSLDAPGPGEMPPLRETLSTEPESPEKVVDEKREIARVREAMQDAPERDRVILELRYGLDGGGRRSFREIAEDFDVSAERVRQLHHRAVRRIREQLAA